MSLLLLTAKNRPKGKIEKKIEKEKEMNRN